MAKKGWEEILASSTLDDVEALSELFGVLCEEYETEIVLYVIMSAMATFALSRRMSFLDFSKAMNRGAIAYGQSHAEMLATESRQVGHA